MTVPGQHAAGGELGESKKRRVPTFFIKSRIPWHSHVVEVIRHKFIHPRATTVKDEHCTRCTYDTWNFLRKVNKVSHTKKHHSREWGYSTTATTTTPTLYPLPRSRSAMQTVPELGNFINVGVGIGKQKTTNIHGCEGKITSSITRPKHAHTNQVRVKQSLLSRAPQTTTLTGRAHPTSYIPQAHQPLRLPIS